MSRNSREFDFILVGGGLQAGLLTLAIRFYQPHAKILILESKDCLFGNHTWSFHERDISREWDWLGPLPINKWPAYAVQFPAFERRVELPYCSFSSEKLAALFESMLAEGDRIEVKTGEKASSVGSTKVATAAGQVFEGRTVVDCRGQISGNVSGAGFQKFYGIEIVLDQDWPDELPVLMDANVDQADGFRFLYVLPFSRRRILIEDTHFSDFSQLDKADSLEQIHSYLARKSISDFQVVREEEGCLPMPFTSAMRPTGAGRLAGGYAGGWFHAATGYSFALAAHFADAVASSPPELVQQEVSRLCKTNQFQSSFSRVLNRLLFRLVSPTRRFEIFRRFYRSLPDKTIQRFYAHKFTKSDAARILIGSPPGGLTPIRFIQSFKALTCPV